MLVIIGESASGKSTLQEVLINDTNNTFKKVITYTTRPMRKGEVNGKDYHFISEDKFEKLVADDFFVEYAKYRNWAYGMAKKDCINAKDSVAILTPAGLRALKRIDAETTSVYLYVDRRSRLISILARGDDIDEAYRRNLSDVGQFDEVAKEVDYVIDNSFFHMDKEQVLRCLKEILKRVKGEM